MYAHEGVIKPVIMHCRAPESYNFLKKLGFKLHDVINCKEKTVLVSIKDAFEEEDMKTQQLLQATRLISFFMSINWQ